ncbi:MAG TPA: phage tail protein [Roseiflexaceae bacterium]|nr:phage tail protein [Roseiflexaceae bacterium]
MDPNGQRFWLLGSRESWQLDSGAGVEYDGARRRLRLRSASRTLPPPGLAADAEQRLSLTPGAVDGFGTRALYDPDDRLIKVSGALDTEAILWAVPANQSLTDMATGFDGVLYLALEGDVVLIDLRQRWPVTRVSSPDLKVWRLAPDPAGGVWALDRISRRLGRVHGLPLANRVFRSYAPDVARPCVDDPDPPRLTLLDSAELPAGEDLAGLACSPEGNLALLTWGLPRETTIRLLDHASGRLGAPVALAGAHYPYSAAWVCATRLALMQTGSPDEALVYDLSAALERPHTPRMIEPSGDFYPLRDHQGGPFLQGPVFPPHYLASPPNSPRISAPLHPLSLPNYVERGAVAAATLIDSGSGQTVWHRLYLEAVIPPGCGASVWLAAGDSPTPPAKHDAPVAPEQAALALEAGRWFEHRFGQRPAQGGDETPVGTWLPDASELPGQPGMLGCAPEPQRAGLFCALIQRAGRRVRTLRGRYLHVWVELRGNGLSSPELAGLRAYGSRFSYVQRYLPELYREQTFGPEADQAGPATERDFFERFVALFESVLTPLEDRVAHAYLVSDARTAPEEALEWLGSWIGVGFDPAYPIERRRALLAQAPQLFRLRGTLPGLKLALDIASGGGVRGGEIVVLEDFRLRRTFATILGADLADEQDPLLQGLVSTGNSLVGDTLFLGDAELEQRKEFLALFSSDLPQTEAERAQASALLDRLANRVTVLVHQDCEPQDLALIRRIVEQEAPAHVDARVLASSYPFLVGMAALVGVDTYLRDEPPARPVTLERSRLGERDYLLRPASLDPRLGGGAAPPVSDMPTVVLDAPP